MPITAPEHIVDEPDAGWPWHLQHCWVRAVKGEGTKATFLYKCQLCGHENGSHSTRHRIAMHYRGEKGQR